MSIAIELMEHGWLPDWLICLGIRRLLRQRLLELGNVDAIASANRQWVAELQESPLAIETNAANEQHYEVSAAFFERMLGRRLKYSSCLFEPGVVDLDAAEDAMLRLTCERAQIADGMRVLDLGCGWGSLSLWIIEQFPNCEVVSVSNSRSQHAFIEGRVLPANARRLRVQTADINVFEPEGHFDRVVSVEMFEHLRNYRELFARIACWLRPEGKAFAHIFCHRKAAYPFETAGDGNWMGKYFFTGGQMPSVDLFSHFQQDLRIEQQWTVNGVHYSKTLLAWLDKIDANRPAALAALQATYGESEARLWLQRWRVFLLACAELFAWNQGAEWHVEHYRWAKTLAR